MPGPGHGNMHYARPKNTGKTFSRIFKYIGVYKWRLIIVAFCILISSGAGVAGTYMLKPIVNLISGQNPDYRKFAYYVIALFGIYLLGVIGTYAYQRVMLTISTGTLAKVRKDMFNHMQKLPIKYFDTHTHGELMSRYTNDTDSLREMLSNGIPQFFSCIITIIGVFTMMVILSGLLTLLVILMLIVMIFVVKKVGGKSAGYFREQQKNVGRVNGYIEEMIEGQKVIKVFNHEDIVKNSFDQINEELRVSTANANTFASILMPIMGNLSYLHYALTAAVGAVLAINGYIDGLGTIASFLQYTRSFSMPITQISQQLNSILSALSGAERIFELIDSVPEEDSGKVTLVYASKKDDGTLVEADRFEGTWAWKKPTENGYEYIELRGDVRLLDAVFGYEEDKTVLNKITLYAKPGQKIAFVGSTGAGKTTITNLLNRFYDLSEGIITYDGINILDIKKDDLRHSMAMVLQDTHLFTGTVMDNIRYGRLDASDEEVIEAAKLANADSFIKHLSHGYNTLLTSDGANLSQGQRQLLSIARAAVANPPVLILDEATSSIDTRTEHLIEKGMDKLMEGRTVFVIAHRLSTVRNSNAIMVLENGSIIERGDHNDLIKQQGKYYQLYTGMFELD